MNKVLAELTNIVPLETKPPDVRRMLRSDNSISAGSGSVHSPGPELIPTTCPTMVSPTSVKTEPEEVSDCVLVGATIGTEDATTPISSLVQTIFRSYEMRC